MPASAEKPTGAEVLGVLIHAITWNDILNRISEWCSRQESRMICICNVHSIVTSRRDARLARALRHADLATPDGAPVAWMLRRLGFPGQSRINGPDLMERYCAVAAARGEPIFLYGSTTAVLQRLVGRLQERYPGLVIAGAISPPFREQTDAEEREVLDAINASGARTLWVGLGCPKQELWMDAHRGKVQAVMVGVGAAFDYIAGTTKRAPRWMQQAGLEWAYRFFTEPRRLARRYLVTNTLFLLNAAIQLAGNVLRPPS